MKLNLKNSLAKAGKYVTDHRQGFLIGGGIGGFAVGMILMIPATLNAKKALDRKTEEKGEPLTKFEKFKAVAPHYIIPTLVGVGSGVSIAVGAKEYNDAVVGLTSGLSVAEKRIDDLEKAIPEAFGENADRKVEHQINKDKVEEIDMTGTDKEDMEDNGVYRFTEPTTGIEFTRAPYEVKNGLANFNLFLQQEGAATIADLLDFLHVDISGASEKAREIAYNTEFITNGLNDTPRTGFEVCERSDGRFGAIITYDRRFHNRFR